MGKLLLARIICNLSRYLKGLLSWQKQITRVIIKTQVQTSSSEDAIAWTLIKIWKKWNLFSHRIGVENAIKEIFLEASLSWQSILMKGKAILSIRIVVSLLRQKQKLMIKDSKLRIWIRRFKGFRSIDFSCLCFIFNIKFWCFSFSSHVYLDRIFSATQRWINNGIASKIQQKCIEWWPISCIDISRDI